MLGGTGPWVAAGISKLVKRTVHAARSNVLLRVADCWPGAPQEIVCKVATWKA